MPRLSNKQKKLRSIARARKTKLALVLAALDSDSDNEPDNDSDIYLSAISRQSNERTNERRRDRSSTAAAARSAVNIVPKLHRRPLRSAIATPRVGPRGGRSPGAIAQQWRRNDRRCRSVRFLFGHGVQWLSAGFARGATRDATRYDGPPTGRDARNVARGPNRGHCFKTGSYGRISPNRKVNFRYHGLLCRATGHATRTTDWSRGMKHPATFTNNQDLADVVAKARIQGCLVAGPQVYRRPELLGGLGRALQQQQQHTLR
jgi:hypothetical protein